MQQKSHQKSSHAQTTIELNGKLYDAHTGKPLAHEHKTAKAKKLDGVSRAQHKQPPKAVHSRPERSHTLMRHAVRKPHQKLNIGKTVAAMDVVGNQVLTSFAPVTLPNESENSRNKRAKAVNRSKLVSRFGNLKATADDFKLPEVKKSVISLPVVPPPVQTPEPTHKKSASEHLLSKALKAADAHKSKPLVHKKTRLHHRVARKLGVSHKLASVGLAGVAVLVLGTFIAYQNMPNFAVRYASAKAGINAHLPSYRPSGFVINDRIVYSPGQITVNFKTNADERSFSLTQKASNWSSEALVANYLEKVTAGGPKAQPFSDNGRTIYLYGDANATWVSEGVWYEISGNSGLTTDQLIKIATSI